MKEMDVMVTAIMDLIHYRNCKIYVDSTHEITFFASNDSVKQPQRRRSTFKDIKW